MIATIELRHTGQGGAYGEWIRRADEVIQVAAFEAAETEALETDSDCGEIEVGGQAYRWRKC